MTLRVDFSMQSRHDLNVIWDHIARDNPDAADRLIDDFQQAVRTAAVFPNAGRRRDDLIRGLRSLAVGRYLLFYRQVRGRIVVYRVMHGARDLPDLL